MTVAAKGHVKGSRTPIVDGVFFACPTSGFFSRGKKIKAHAMQVRFCRDGNALFLCCNAHQTRAFVNDPEIVKRCKDAQRDQALEG